MNMFFFVDLMRNSMSIDQTFGALRISECSQPNRMQTLTKNKKNKKETESNQWRKSGKASEEKIEYCTKHRIEKKEI